MVGEAGRAGRSCDRRRGRAAVEVVDRSDQSAGAIELLALRRDVGDRQHRGRASDRVDPLDARGAIVQRQVAVNLAAAAPLRVDRVAGDRDRPQDRHRVGVDLDHIVGVHEGGHALVGPVHARVGRRIARAAAAGRGADVGVAVGSKHHLVQDEVRAGGIGDRSRAGLHHRDDVAIGLVVDDPGDLVGPPMPEGVDCLRGDRAQVGVSHDRLARRALVDRDAPQAQRLVELGVELSRLVVLRVVVHQGIGLAVVVPEAVVGLPAGADRAVRLISAVGRSEGHVRAVHDRELSASPAGERRP